MDDGYLFIAIYEKISTHQRKLTLKKKQKIKKIKNCHLKKKKKNLSFYPFSKSFSAKTLRLTENHSLPIKQD